MPLAEESMLTFVPEGRLFIVRGMAGLWVERATMQEGRIEVKAYSPTLMTLFLERCDRAESLAKRAFENAIVLHDNDRVICDRCGGGAVFVVERGDDVLCRKCARLTSAS